MVRYPTRLASQKTAIRSAIYRTTCNAITGMLLQVPTTSRRATQSTPNVSNNACDIFRLGNLTAEHALNTIKSASATRQKTPAWDISLI